MELGPWVKVIFPTIGPAVMPSTRVATLLIDGQPVGQLDTKMVGFNSQVSFSGLDIGLDRGSPVSHYEAPFAFTGGKLYKVSYSLDPMQKLDYANLAQVAFSRQ
jgi:hypothetical protein